MFPRRNRLKRAAFGAALSTGKRHSTPHFLLVVPREGVGYAVVIPKKIARLSVARHLLKRRVLAVLRSLDALPASLIVFPRASATRLGYDDIRAELADALHRLAPR